MRIPTTWKRTEGVALDPGGREWKISAWGWSDGDVTQALALAKERLQEFAARIAAGELPNSGYEYTDRPVREETIETPATGCVVTRNHYGALVLNSAGVAFFDWDLPPASFMDLLGGLIGRGRAWREERAQHDLKTRLAGEAGASFRLYRTAAGFRAIRTDREMDPLGPESDALMERLGCDPFYRRICRAQGSFRARLTPKHWRIGIAMPPGRWPREDAALQAQFSEWLRGYNKAIGDRATCRYLEQVGSARPTGAIAAVVDHHDRATRSTWNGALA